VVRDVFGRLDAQAAWPRVQELVDAWAPDVVLREPCEFGSLAAAVRSGVPHVEMAIGLGSLQQWAGQALVDPLGELDGVTRPRPGVVRRGDVVGARPVTGPTESRRSGPRPGRERCCG
jgi:hypothetical protein